MGEIEYRLGLDGTIYTWEEFQEGRWFSSATPESKKKEWLGMQVVDVPEGKLEETKKLMKYLHKIETNFHPSHPLFIKDPTKLLKIL